MASNDFLGLGFSSSERNFWQPAEGPASRQATRSSRQFIVGLIIVRSMHGDMRQFIEHIISRVIPLAASVCKTMTRE